jgi:uncharacterized membrane protein YesL
MAAFRTLWMALVGLYEETITLVAANLGALGLNVPVGLVLFVIGLPLAASDANGAQWLIATIACLMPLLPTPGNVALGGVTRVAAGPDVPTLTLFSDALRTRWRRALRSSVVSVVVTVALVWNVWFYYNVGTGWLQFVSILWLYATFFWLSLHIYVVPLLVHVADPRLFDIYRRAAFVALGHPAYTILLLLTVLVFDLLSVAFLPVYVLVGSAFINLAQAHALREIRRRHGDLSVEPEEEVSRL